MSYNYKHFPSTKSILAHIEGHPGITTKVLAFRLGMPKRDFQKFIFSKGVFDLIAGSVRLRHDRWYLKESSAVLVEESDGKMDLSYGTNSNLDIDIKSTPFHSNSEPVTNTTDVRASLVSSGISYSISVCDTVAAVPFRVDYNRVTGKVIILLNKQHSAFPLFKPILPSNISDTGSPKEGYRATMFLLLSWARYETSLNDIERIRVEDIRMDWGRILRNLVESSVTGDATTISTN
jgi:hypothetical protein